MPGFNRILWGEGLFLRPQHFQQQDLFFETSLAQAMRLSRAHPWGVRRVLLDVDALRGGIAQLDDLEAVFQDGTQINAPASMPLPLARNLADIPQLGTETVLYACLPLLNPFGGNSGEPGGQMTRLPRYTISRGAAVDLYTEALESELTFLHPHVRLMVAEENRDGHLSLAVGRIVKNALGDWELDEDYIPPLVEVGGSPWLAIAMRRLLDILLVKSHALTASHRERVKSVVEYGTSDIASFWLLHTINRAFPLLNHYASVATHPEALYQLFAQLCGELMTFSSERTLGDIPAYQHEHLTQVFSRLDELIRELLETVISSRYALIPLVNTKPSFHVGRLDSERLVENVDYYLSVSSEMPTTQILEMVPLKFKAGSPDDVEKILNSALPGVQLAHAPQTPAALPVRVGNHYFILEPQGSIFERMCKARSICIYVPQSLSSLKLELFAVFR